MQGFGLRGANLGVVVDHLVLLVLAHLRARSGFRVRGLGFRVQGKTCKVEGAGCKVEGGG